jgi:coenzyme F420-0:L-glutamate ligase/coenzyme F420-1:gamma-L-glutamate ligase
MSAGIRLTPLTGIPLIGPHDDLAGALSAAAERAGIRLRDGALVVCQKVVSKAEGRTVALADVEPGEEARRIAAEEDKDPRQVELVLRESVRLVRRGHGVLISETRHGFVCANAGIDLSNAPGEDIAVLLPEDPDASARRLRDALAGPDARLGVIVSDTFGRPWREGLVDVALGCAGMSPIRDARGSVDLSGRELQVTTSATADQLAAAAGLLMEKAAGIPAVWVEGVAIEGDAPLASLLRDPSGDLFR